MVLDPAVLAIGKALVKELMVYEDPDENRAFRFQAYRQYTLWVNGRFFRRSKKAVPSCCTLRIRAAFPDPEGNYVPFFANRDDV